MAQVPCGVDQCYAIEGRYPPSVEYLEENYAVQINRKKYNVFYDGFASNVMPEITNKNFPTLRC